MTSIHELAVYTPRFRIDAETVADAWDGFEARGVETKSVAAADEDAITMGVEAAREALGDADLDREAVAGLHVATTTPPIEEGDVAATAAEILGLPSDVVTTVHSQSTRAGTRALRAALGADGHAIVVAADAPLGAPGDRIDHAAGAGAVALVTGPDGDAVVEETATYTREYPGTRFRRRGSDRTETYGATSYERRAFSETVGEVVGDIFDPAPAVAVTAPDGSLPHRAERTIAPEVDGDVEVYHAANRFGDVGAASALFGLAVAWDAGVESVTLIGYGDGAGADAFVVAGSLDVSLGRETEAIDYPTYLRKRGHVVDEGDA